MFSPISSSCTIFFFFFDFVTVKCFILFSTLFQLYFSNQCIHPYCSGVSHTSIILSKPLAASHITIVETMVMCERELNSFVMTIINPWKQIIGNRQAISPFPTVFSTLLENFLPFSSN